MEHHPPPRPRPRRLFVVMLVAVPAAMLALVLLLAVVLRACNPEEVPEATFEDYCDAVHGTFSVAAVAQDDGVLVTWESMLYDTATEYVVHRRPSGSTQWQRVAAPTVGPVERGELLSHLDTTPAERPDVAYEYGVSHVFPECGGESELNTFDPEPFPTATPPQR